MCIGYKNDDVVIVKEGYRKFRVTSKSVNKAMKWHLRDHSVVNLKSVLLDFVDERAYFNPLGHGNCDTRCRPFYGVTSMQAALEKRPLLEVLGAGADTQCFRFVDWCPSMCVTFPYNSPTCYVFLGRHHDYLFKDFRGTNLQEINSCKLTDFEAAMKQ